MRIPPVAGASREVIEHHARQHPCRDAGHYEFDCPCDATTALVCHTCHQLLFLCVRPGTWCEHAEWLWREVNAV